MSDVVNFEGGCGYPGNSHRSEAEASKEQEKNTKIHFKKRNETRSTMAFALLGVSRIVWLIKTKNCCWCGPQRPQGKSQYMWLNKNKQWLIWCWYHRSGSETEKCLLFITTYEFMGLWRSFWAEWAQCCEFSLLAVSLLCYFPVHFLVCHLY